MTYRYSFDNKLEFYITNVCNLTCEHCNRFNNHRFSGWQRWSDYADIYQQWTQFVDIRNVVLMGGEPLLNPTVCDWAAGIAETFGCDVQILTNGLHLTKVKNLYHTLLNNRGHVGISLHNLQHWPMIKQYIKEFLDPVLIDEYGTALGDSRGDKFIYYSARDINQMLVNVYLQNDFATSSLIADGADRWRLHNSDPGEAHSRCSFVRYRSYHFIRGALYKCGPVALWSEFDQQHPLQISESDRALINSYQPMTPDLWPTQGEQFMQQLDQVIPQCKFCPTKHAMTIIQPMIKKSMA